MTAPDPLGAADRKRFIRPDLRARIRLSPTTDEDAARAQFAAVAAGQSSEFLPMPDQARIVTCGADQLAVVVTHKQPVRR